MTLPATRVPGESLVEDRGPRHRADRVPTGAPTIGVLALQGDVLEHLRLLEQAGARGTTVRRAGDLAGLDGLVLPGGESTTIGLLLQRHDLTEPLRRAVAAGFPVLGTCAGAILLAERVVQHDGRPSEQPRVGGLDVTARRNAFGRQVASFEADLTLQGLDAPLRAVFIRAPWFEELGPDVEPLAAVATPAGDAPVVVRHGALLASAFHPELTDDARLHRLFVADAVARTRA